jgi:hypothetical protein
MTGPGPRSLCADPVGRPDSPFSVTKISALALSGPELVCCSWSGDADAAATAVGPPAAAATDLPEPCGGGSVLCRQRRRGARRRTRDLRHDRLAALGRADAGRERVDRLAPKHDRSHALLGAGGDAGRGGAHEPRGGRLLGRQPKSIEAHLVRAYRKLGIRSRAELGARMAQRRHPGEVGAAVSGHTTPSKLS